MKRLFCFLALMAAIILVGCGKPDFSDAEKKTVASLALNTLPSLKPDTTNRFADVPARFWFENALQFSALLTGIVSRSKRINIALLAVLIVLYLFTAVMSFIQPPPL